MLSAVETTTSIKTGFEKQKNSRWNSQFIFLLTFTYKWFLYKFIHNETVKTVVAMLYEPFKDKRNRNSTENCNKLSSHSFYNSQKTKNKNCLGL